MEGYLPEDVQDHQKAVEAALAADREAALRDVFAAAALSALVANYPRDMFLSVADWSYKYADAMLTKRKDAGC